MSAYRRSLFAALCFAAITGAACRAHSASATAAVSSNSSASDSVRGVLSLVGNDPLSVLLLTPSAGTKSEAFVLTGSAASLDALRHVVGVEIVVFGTRTNARSATATPLGAPIYDVQRFLVRLADGIVATDGVIVANGTGFALRLVDGGEVAVAVMPASLRRMLGARVWLSGALSSAPQAYGVIREPR